MLERDCWNALWIVIGNIALLLTNEHSADSTQKDHLLLLPGLYCSWVLCIASSSASCLPGVIVCSWWSFPHLCYVLTTQSSMRNHFAGPLSALLPDACGQWGPLLNQYDSVRHSSAAPMSAQGIGINNRAERPNIVAIQSEWPVVVLKEAPIQVHGTSNYSVLGYLVDRFQQKPNYVHTIATCRFTVDTSHLIVSPYFAYSNFFSGYLPIYFHIAQLSTPSSGPVLSQPTEYLLKI